MGCHASGSSEAEAVEPEHHQGRHKEMDHWLDCQLGGGQGWPAPALPHHLQVESGLVPGPCLISGSSKCRPAIPCHLPPLSTDLGASFLQLAYDDKDPPVSKSMPKLAQLVQFHIPVRNTSKLIQPSGAPSSHPMACGSNMQALSPLLELLQQMQKRVPEQALLQMTPVKRSKSSLALEMGSMSCVVAPALEEEQVATAPTMLAVPDQLPTALAFQPRLRLPAFSGPPLRPQQPAKVEPSAAPSMSLEEYETAAFEALKQKKIRSKGVEEESTAATTFKKPAGAKNTHLEGHILGCATCRGSSAGCTQCRKPDFKGVRMYGRDAYEKHVQQKQHHMAAAAKKSNKKSELCR